jgi:hypothetical protein
MKVSANTSVRLLAGMSQNSKLRRFMGIILCMRSAEFGRKFIGMHARVGVFEFTLILFLHRTLEPNTMRSDLVYDSSSALLTI